MAGFWLRKISETDARALKYVAIHFQCHGCHAKYKASSNEAGKEVTCKNCETKIVVSGIAKEEVIYFHCHVCHAKYKTSPNKAGKEVTCKRCKTIIVIPGK